MSTKKQTKKQTQKGFTLVEVIVVAVIVAILAAVAIPIYQQYVTDSRSNAAANVAGALASFSGACLATDGVVGGIATTSTTAGKATCTKNSTVVTQSVIPANMTITYTARIGTTPGSITVTHADGGTGTTINF